jgi:hypothetical protein
MLTHNDRRKERADVDTGSPAAEPAPRLPPLDDFIIAARIVEGGERQSAPVPYDDILFAFQPGAVGRLVRGTHHLAIDAEWSRPGRLRGRKVHLRTATGIFRTKWNSLGEAIAHLAFLRVQRSYHGTLAVLKTKIRLDLDGKVKRIGYVVGRDVRGADRIEWLVLSRRAGRELRKRSR